MRGLLIAVAAFVPPARAGDAAEAALAVDAAKAPPSAIKGGHDQKSSWLVADYRELQVRKRTDRAALR